LIKYYIPVKKEDKRIYLEGIDGGFINIDPLYKNIVARAKKYKKAIRIPDNIKLIKLADVVDIELFYSARSEFINNKLNENNNEP